MLSGLEPLDEREESIRFPRLISARRREWLQDPYGFELSERLVDL